MDVSSRATTRRTLLRSAAVIGGALATQALAPLGRALAGAPAILKPLPADRFVDFGTNAEMRWSSVDPRRYLTPQSRLFVRNHTATPTIDAATYALKVYGDGLRSPRTAADPITRDPARPQAAAADHADHHPRVHRQRAQLLRDPAGHAGLGHRVDARRGRHRALGGRAAARPAPPPRARPRRGLGPGDRAGPAAT